MKKLVIFDLDGTLLDTIEDLAASCNHALSECGFAEREKEEYYMLVGRGIDNLFRGALPEGNRSDDDVFRIRESFLKYYNAHNCDLTKPYDGITDMLRTLSSKGVALAVASNKYQFGTETLINRYFPDIHFTHILGQREGRNVKPDPQIIYDAMDGFNKESTFYCGDSDVDMMTGNNAGVKTIGVTWGFRKREELKRHNPWLLVDSPSEIVSAVMDSKK